MLASEISEVNVVNPENCYELAHNRYLKRSQYVDNKKGTLQRVVLKLADGLLLGEPPATRTLDAVRRAVSDACI